VSASAFDRWRLTLPFVLPSPGGLLLPLIAVLAARQPRVGPAILALEGTGLVLQPDAGALLALGMASAALAALSHAFACAAVRIAALGMALGSIAARPQILK
jgi:hypothetical protein